MPTAQQLVDLGNGLLAFAGGIDDYIDGQPNPYDPAFIRLRTLEGQIGSAANQVASLAIAMLAPAIATATQNLTAKVDAAQAVLETVENAQKATHLIAAVLAVAVAAASGNPFSAARSVAQLASQLQAVLT